MPKDKSLTPERIKRASQEAVKGLRPLGGLEITAIKALANANFIPVKEKNKGG